MSGWENGDYLYLRLCEQEHRRRMNEASKAGKKLAWIRPLLTKEEGTI